MTFTSETNASFMRLPNGKIVRKVSEEEYMLCEQIRNYIYRTNYETGISIEVASWKAQCLFKVDDKTVERALHKWKNWFYGDGRRHRPIELFIHDHERWLAEQDKVNIEIKHKPI